MFLLLPSSTHTASGPFLLLTPPHQWGDWGCPRSWEGTQPRQLTTGDQRGIIECMVSTYRAGGKVDQGQLLGDWLLSWLLVSSCFSFAWLVFFVVYFALTLFFFFSSFSLYDCYYCCYTIISSTIIIVKLLLSQPTSFFHFYLSNSPPACPDGWKVSEHLYGV